MPYESKAQQGWAHTPAGTKALGGPEKVKEWDQATKGSYGSLPGHVKKYATGGLVVTSKSEGPHNEADFAFGGGQTSRSRNWSKTSEPKDFKKEGSTDFLGTENKFVGKKLPKGEATTEDWTKPAGVGHTDKDDKGDDKSEKPILPRK